MLLRGGRRVALLEWAVVALEVAGDGVEAGGEEDALVAGATPEGESDNKDMFAIEWGSIFQEAVVCLYVKVEMLFSGFAYSILQKSRCVTIRPTSGDAGVENDRIVFQILFSRSSVKRERIYREKK